MTAFHPWRHTSRSCTHPLTLPLRRGETTALATGASLGQFLLPSTGAGRTASVKQALLASLVTVPLRRCGERCFKRHGQFHSSSPL